MKYSRYILATALCFLSVCSAGCSSLETPLITSAPGVWHGTDITEDNQHLLYLLDCERDGTARLEISNRADNITTYFGTWAVNRNDVQYRIGFREHGDYTFTVDASGYAVLMCPDDEKIIMQPYDETAVYLAYTIQNTEEGI